jgi:hypothetical protein
MKNNLDPDFIKKLDPDFVKSEHYQRLFGDREPRSEGIPTPHPSWAFGNDVLTDNICPICGLKMSLRPKCCGQPTPMLRCKCGYKEVANDT